MPRRNWTQEEVDYLQDKWGVVSTKGIAKNLARSIESVKLKAGRIGLTDARFSIDGITISQLMQALKKDFRKAERWIEQMNFPVKRKVWCKTATVRYVKYEDFWGWAEENKREIDWAKVERNILGSEPAWVDKWRRKDYYNKVTKRNHNDPWTVEEDAKLVKLLNAFKYTYVDIYKMLDRSEAAIKRRIFDLGLKQRPVRRKARHWSEEETKTLTAMFGEGYDLHEIGEKVGRTALAVRGKLERMERMEAV